MGKQSTRLYCLFALTGSIELHRCATTCAVGRCMMEDVRGQMYYQ